MSLSLALYADIFIWGMNKVLTEAMINTISAILGAIVGGALTLLANYINQKHTDKVAKEGITKEKLEEAYLISLDVSDRIPKRLALANQHGPQLKPFPETEAIEYDAVSSFHSLDKLKMLINIYGENIKEEFQHTEKLYSEFEKKLFNLAMSPLKESFDKKQLSRDEYREELLELSTFARDKLEKALKDLRTALEKELKK